MNDSADVERAKKPRAEGTGVWRTATSALSSALGLVLGILLLPLHLIVVGLRRLALALAFHRLENLFRSSRWQEAHQLFATVFRLDLESSASANEQILSLRARLFWAPAGTLERILTLYAMLLGVNGHSDRALELLESLGGITQELYLKREAIHDKFQESLSESGPFAVLLWTRLAHTHGFLNRHDMELLVLECTISSGQVESLTQDEVLSGFEKLRTQAGALSCVLLGTGLALSLAKAQKLAPAREVLLASLDINRRRFADSEALVSEVLRVINTLSPGGAVSALVTLAVSMRTADEDGTVLRAIENYFRLSPTLYGPPSAVRRLLFDKLSSLPELPRAILVRALASELIRADRTSDAVTVVLADLGVGHEALEGHEVFWNALRDRLRSLPNDAAGVHLDTVCVVLARSGLDQLFASTMAAIAGLKSEGGSEIAFPDISALEVAGFGKDTLISYVTNLALAAARSGNQRRAEELLDIAVLHLPDRIDLEQDPRMLVPLSTALGLWLDCSGRHDSKRPDLVVARIVSTLRGSIGVLGSSATDRELLLETISSFRRKALLTASFWLPRAGDVGQAVRQSLASWEAQLGQRLLVERFLLRSEMSRESSGRVLGGDWALRVPEPAWKGHLPPLEEVQAYLGLLGTLNVVRPQESESAPLGDDGARLEVGEAATRLKSLLSRELTLGLHDGELLIHLSFDLDGRLVVAVFDQLESALCVREAWAGEPENRAEVEWAVAQFGLRDQLSKILLGPPWRSARRVSVLSSLAEAIAKLRTHVGGSSEYESMANELTGQLDSVFDGSLQVPEHRKCLFLAIRELVWPLLERPVSEEYGRWALRCFDQLVRAQAEVERVARLGKVSTRNYRCGALTQLLESVTATMPAGFNLAEHVCDKNIVFQVAEELRLVPVSHLPVGSRPLYDLTRSVRTSVNLALDAAHRSAGLPEALDRPSRRLLLVTYVEQDDPATAGETILHHGMRQLARAHGYEIHVGAGSSSGTVEALQGALVAERGFTVAVICGHGCFYESGIVLGRESGGTGVWVGDGCDLSGVGLLVLASCSVGRFKETGALDVEGLCAQLSAHGARSVIACRWPISSGEAAAFTNELVHQYLTLLESPLGLSQGDLGSLRALALNRTRAKFSKLEEPLVSPITAAAFELYGLG